MEKRLGDGRTIYVWAMTFGKGRLSVGATGALTVDDGWCYDTLEGAVRAAIEWDGTGEPTGWMRHLGTGRRRPGGDPSKEYQQW